VPPAFKLSFVKINKRDGWMLDLALMLTPSAGLAYWFLFDEGSKVYQSHLHYGGRPLGGGITSS
jgi:hypothetical protein